MYSIKAFLYTVYCLLSIELAFCSYSLFSMNDTPSTNPRDEPFMLMQSNFVFHFVVCFCCSANINCWLTCNLYIFKNLDSVCELVAFVAITICFRYSMIFSMQMVSRLGVNSFSICIIQRRLRVS